MRKSLSGDIVFIVGPSAAGKSAVALELAASLQGEIISCDALQVYREIRIASDRPSVAAMSAVRHHLFGCISVEEPFNAGRYRSLACSALEDVLSRGRLPVFCGGSGMYMAVLLDGIFEPSRPADPDVRCALEEECRRNGSAALHERLRQVDPASAQRIDPNDRQRTIRALEVFASEGETISALRQRRGGLWGRYRIRLFFLDRPREELYARADARVEQMFDGGLLEEIRALQGKALAPSAARMIGVPEVSGYLSGACSLAQAKELLQRNTRRYIKRQLTWFRRDERLERIGIACPQTPQQTAACIVERLSRPQEILQTDNNDRGQCG